MKKRFAFVALQSIAIAAVIAFSPALGASQLVKAETPLTPPSVSVTGTGKITVKPTIARINFGVFTSKSTSSAAQTENDAIMAKITAATQSRWHQGRRHPDHWIQPSAQVRVEQDDLEVRLRRLRHEPHMTVIVRNIKDAGKTVSLIADNGANRVDGISFDVDDATLEQTRLSAIDLAMASARKRADVVAKAAGKTILSVQTVTVNENANTPYPMFKASATAPAAGGSAPAPVEAGTMDVLISVSVTYLF